jgi:hypothetical protein
VIVIVFPFTSAGFAVPRKRRAAAEQDVARSIGNALVRGILGGLTRR